MKIRVLIFVAFMIFGCNNQPNSTNNLDEKVITDQRLDSLKWLFYAYTFDGKALFEKNGIIQEFRPTECEVRFERMSNSNDSLFYILNLYKEGYKYNHIHDGLMVYG